MKILKNNLGPISLLAVVSFWMASCGEQGMPIANPVSVGKGVGPVVTETREEKIQKVLDAVTLKQEKNSEGIFHIFILNWEPLGSLFESADRLTLERTDPSGAKEYALLEGKDVSYKDTKIPATVGLNYGYRLKLETQGKTLETKSTISALTSKEAPVVDPFAVKPIKPGEIKNSSGQVDMLEKYLNGFKIKWKDESDNEKKFVIIKCAWQAVLSDIDPYSGQPVYGEEQCIGSWTPIEIKVSESSTKGAREYFDEDVVPSTDLDPYRGEYCYFIKAVNNRGESDVIATECERY